MLREIRDDLTRHYFDTTYAGMNLKSRFDSADARIRQASSNSEVFGIIAQVLADLDDSHTWFIPPDRAARVRYSWELGAVGDSIYVLSIRPKSGYDTLGIHVGDRVVSLEGFEPNRQNYWKLRYLVELLRPRAVLHATLESPDGSRHDVVVPAQVKVGRARLDVNNDDDLRYLYLDWADATMHPPLLRVTSLGDIRVWKLESFSIEPDKLDAAAGTLGDARALVIDLRGNGGGYVDTEQRLAEHFVDHKVLLSTGRTRLERGHFEDDTTWAHPVRKPFLGRLVIVVDAQSASASEEFARAMQIEARATVIGDWTAGALRTAMFFPHHAGTGRLVFYGTSITIRDVIMADGGRLEHRGLMPDEEMRPTAADLAAGRDPVLARAVAIAGRSITPEQAGRMFPVQWSW